jgi:ribosomal protein S18 acetylase RimI-like enzyme
LRGETLIETRPDHEDARRQTMRLTAQGWDAHRLIEERCDTKVGDMLGGFASADQDRMVNAMVTIQGIATGSPPQEVVLRHPGPGELGWVVQRHGSLYAAEMGWDVSFEALVARLVADFAGGHDEDRERAWIADLGGVPVGSIFCFKVDEETAQLRMLLVDPAARGRGVGERLVTECVAFAR